MTCCGVVGVSAAKAIRSHRRRRNAEAIIEGLIEYDDYLDLSNSSNDNNS